MKMLSLKSEAPHIDQKAIQKIPLPVITATTATANKPTGTVSVLPPQFAASVVNNPGTVVWQADNVQSQVTDGYCGNDIVYSIIRLITDKVKLAPWKEYKIIDEKSYVKLNAMLASKKLDYDLKAVEEMHAKALEPVQSTTRITELLERPNEQDSWADLIEAYATFKLITGNTYLFAKMIPTGLNANQPFELYTLPSQYMSIRTDLNAFPFVPVGYQLYMQWYENFNLREILHDKYFNPNWNIAGLQLYGLSPLKAAARVVTRSNEGKKAAVANYTNGGPKGLLFIDDTRYDPAQSVQEAIDIKKTLARNQGSANVNQVETSGYKLGHVSLGLTPVELDLLNAEAFDLRALCNVYGGVPSQLLNDAVAKTYNSIPEAEKALTVRCALPMLCSQKDQLNRKFKRDWGGNSLKGNVVSFDPSVYQELQVTRAQTVAWLKDSYLPLERMYEVLGENVPEWLTEEQRRTIFVPSGMQTLQDAIDGILPNPMNDYSKQ